MFNKISNKIKTSFTFIRKAAPPVFLMVTGSFLLAFAYVMFQIPYNIVAGGLSGLALIINSFTGWSIGILYWKSDERYVTVSYCSEAKRVQPLHRFEGVRLYTKRVDPRTVDKPITRIAKHRASGCTGNLTSR